MKKWLASGLCLLLLLAGCSGGGTASETTSVVQPQSETTSVTEQDSDTVSSQDPAVSSQADADSPGTAGAGAYAGVARNMLGKVEDLRTETLSLPDIESITAEQIAKCMISGFSITTTADPACKAPGATRAIRLAVNENRAAGQVIFAEKLKTPLANGLDEAIVLDPVDGSLEGYEGIQYYLKLKRPEGKKYSELKVRFFFGSYSYYRSMYEYTTTLPDGDFEGYVTVPFSEMVNGYNQNPGVSIANIAYFAFNINLEGGAEGLEAYVSGFRAYREMYW